jgi:hypothetical protein
MLNWALIRSPVNWFVLLLMVLLAQLFFELLKDPSTVRNCGCHAN